MRRQVELAVAESEQRMRGQREANEKNVHFSARVMAQNSRIATLQRQLKETQAREKGLMQELDGLRQSGFSRQAGPPDPIPNGAALSISWVCSNLRVIKPLLMPCKQCPHKQSSSWLH